MNGGFFSRIIISFLLSEGSLRRQQHRHVASFQTRLDIDFGDILDQDDDALEHLPAQFWMSNLAPAKKHRNFNPLPFIDKLANIFHLMLDIVGVGA